MAVSLFIDLAPRVAIRISNISPWRKENESTRGARDTDPRAAFLVGVFDEVATQRESEIATNGIADEDDVFLGVAEFGEVHISVE